MKRLLVGVAWLALAAAPALGQAPSDSNVTIDLGQHGGTFYLPVSGSGGSGPVCQEYSLEDGDLSRSFTSYGSEYTSTYSFQEEGGVLYAIHEWVQETDSETSRSEGIYRVMRASEEEIQLADPSGDPQIFFFASRIQCLLHLEKGGN